MIFGRVTKHFLDDTRKECVNVPHAYKYQTPFYIAFYDCLSR